MIVALLVLYLLAAGFVWQIVKRHPILRDAVDIAGINETPYQRQQAARITPVIVGMLWPLLAVRVLWREVRRA